MKSNLCLDIKVKNIITEKTSNPGNSRKLCSIPIWVLSNLAISTTKLLSNAFHVINAKGTRNVVHKSKLVFVREDLKNCIIY